MLFERPFPNLSRNKTVADAVRDVEWPDEAGGDQLAWAAVPETKPNAF